MRCSHRGIRMTNRAGRAACVVTALLLAALPGPAAQAGEADPRSRHPTADGGGVVDEEARLAWSRCVEGMQWDGRTCVGEARFMNHAAALAAAAARAKNDGLPWRLPRVGEMQQMARWSPSARALLPPAPQTSYWSGTAVADLGRVNQYQYQNIRQHVTEENANHIAFLHGWAVDLATGKARDDVLKRTPLPVRLVRSLE